MNSTAFDGSDDFFDSRDVIQRIEELEEQATNDEGDFDMDILMDEGEREEYNALIELRDEVDGNSEWEHGMTFVAEGEFTDYAMDTLADVGYLPRDLPSWIVIDEEATADNMKQDYAEFEFRGTTYYAR